MIHIELTANYNSMKNISEENVPGEKIAIAKGSFPRSIFFSTRLRIVTIANAIIINRDSTICGSAIFERS